jgi:hypothetical protein
MNTITEIFGNFNADEKAAFGDTAANLAAQWDAADAEGKAAIELQFTEALNTFRSSEV